jgi:hypothetical protein
MVSRHVARTLKRAVDDDAPLQAPGGHPVV